MSSPSRRPFERLTSEKWLNLALASLGLFYLLQIGLDIVWHNLCGHLGVDYCAFWSAGLIANTSGYAAIYDLDRLAALERSLFPSFGDPATFAVSPFAYLPPFVLPFQLLALMAPSWSFWLWTAINLGALAGYLHYFSISTTGRPAQNRVLAMLLLSIPTFWNFLDGQVNVWLTICAGEFLRATLADKPFRSGLWLGGFLLKPQNLVLIVPALCLQRRGRSLGGLAASSGALLIASFMLIGSTGTAKMMTVWLGFAQGIPTNYVELMMNWRMLAVHIATLFGPSIGWLTAGAGILATSVVSLRLWRHPIASNSQPFAIALLGTLAATATVAWHSHVPTAMMLIPPLLLLQQRGQLPKQALQYWLFVPVLAYVLALILAAGMRVGQGAQNSIIATSGFLNFIRGGSVFVLNLYLLIWASRRLGQLRADSARAE